MSRVKPKEFWEKHIEVFRKSRMSQRAYCKANNLKPRALQYHLCKSQRKEPGNSFIPEKKCDGWLPMSIIDEPTSDCSGGMRLQISRITIEAERGFDNTHLMNVLRTVGVVC